MKIGIADTMFARADMGALAERTIKENNEMVLTERYTVPGIKDLPVASKILFQKGCDLVIALGMPGREKIDEQCAHEASQGIIQLQVLEGKHVIEVFVHESEAVSDKELAQITRNRVVKHSLNALDLLCNPQALKKRAGTGQRQGKENAKQIEL
jgi:riboflavin synthase